MGERNEQILQFKASSMFSSEELKESLRVYIRYNLPQFPHLETILSKVIHLRVCDICYSILTESPEILIDRFNHHIWRVREGKQAV